MGGVRFGTSLTYLGVYVAAFLLGRLTTITGSGLAMFWPVAGVAVLWLLRGTTRDQVSLDALLLFLGTTLLVLGFGTGPVAAAIFAAANLVQGAVVRLTAAWFARKPVTADLQPGIRCASDLLELGAGTLAGALLSAPIGMVGVRLNTGGWSTLAFSTWVVRNACGSFVVAAAVLAILSAYRAGLGSSLVQALAGEERPHVVAELFAAVTLTLGTGVLVFTSDRQLPIGFVLIASSAWIGFRFTPLVGGVHTLTFGGVVVVCSLQGWGPFGSIEDLAVRTIVVQLFVAVTAVITLMLALGVAERGRLLQRLRESEVRANARAEMLDGVTQALIDGLAVIDSHGEVLLSNAAARVFAGPDEPQTYYDLEGRAIDPQELPHARALAGEVVTPTDVLRIDPHTGAQQVLSVSAVPLYDSHGDDGPMAVLLIHDVTRERGQTRELEAFAGVVAHDLNSPLASVMSWAEILDDQLDQLVEDATPARASLVKIYRSADQMQRLLGDLLLLTRARSSELRLGTVSLDALVQDAARAATDSAAGLQPRIEHGPLGVVRADETLVSQVLSNLVGNAVKYVAPGVQPVVRITARPVGDLVEVRVSDNGVGIPAADQGRIFDSWFRSDSTRDRYPGTGLGLSISARAVERHGGTISARAGLDGTGTIFTFTLPAEPSPQLRIAPDPAPVDIDDEQPDQREGRTTSADPPPRRTGSDTAVS
jgi:signal transduction histidine kinase